MSLSQCLNDSTQHSQRQVNFGPLLERGPGGPSLVESLAASQVHQV